jgi:hypothetical protein
MMRLDASCACRISVRLRIENGSSAGLHLEALAQQVLDVVLGRLHALALA